MVSDGIEMHSGEGQLERATREVMEGLFEEFRDDRHITIRERNSIGPVKLKGDFSAATELLESLRDRFNGSSLIDFNLSVEDDQLLMGCETTGYVGFQGFPELEQSEEEGWLHELSLLRIKPKVKKAQWLSLVGLAQGWGRDELKWLESAGLEIGEAGMGWQLAELYRLALHRLFDEYGGLRQLHIRRREVLRNRLKGRLHVNDYMKNIMGGRVERVPCEYSGLRLDCWPNRMLLAALQVARRLKQDGPTDEIGPEASGRRLGEMESSFGGVEAGAFDLNQAGQGRLPEVFRGYEASMALPIARLLLQQASIHDEAGRFEVDGFQVNMSWFYERAFSKLVEREVCSNPTYEGFWSPARWTYEVKNSPVSSLKSGRFEPDIYVRPQATEGDEEEAPAVVIDMKWKSVLESNKVGDALKKAGFSNPDLYQIATYTQIAGSKNEGRPVVGVLVYPTDGVDVEQTISQVQLRGDDAQKLPLWVAGWDVTSTPAASGRELWRKIKALRNRTEKGPIKADPRAD